MSATRSTGPPNRAEFEALYQHHSREVWALAYALWTTAAAAMDHAEEAFLGWGREGKKGGGTIPRRGWLLGVPGTGGKFSAKGSFRRNAPHPPQTMNGVQAH